MGRKICGGNDLGHQLKKSIRQKNAFRCKHAGGFCSGWKPSSVLEQGRPKPYELRSKGLLKAPAGRNICSKEYSMHYVSSGGATCYS